MIISIKDDICYEDEYIIVCNKRAGIAVQTKRIGQMDMESMLRNYMASKGEKPYVGIVHRLDQPVEGIMVFAKTPFAASQLSKQMHTFEKYYLAVVCGSIAKTHETLVDYVLKDGRNNTSKVVSMETPEAKKAVLTYEILGRTITYSLVKVKLETGRHHQIRVQMAHIGHPLAGDVKYGGSLEDINLPLALCSYHIGIIHPSTNKKLIFETKPCGEWFTDFSKEISILIQG